MRVCLCLSVVSSLSFLLRYLNYIFCQGELPLPVVELIASMRCNGKDVDMEKAGPGFTLPADIGDLDLSISDLILYGCNLTGEPSSVSRIIQLFKILYVALYCLLAASLSYKCI